MKKINLLLIIFGLICTMSLISSAAVGPNWIEQWGITWTFDKNISSYGAGGTYQYGQFVNGDWWVVPDVPGGSVKVVSIDPAPVGTETSLRNGSMINPATGFRSKQGYSGNASDFDESLVRRPPLTLQADDSLLSSISRTEEEIDKGPSSLRGNGIKTIAVLTCLAETPAADAFRPHYTTGAKVIHSAGRLQRQHLPNLIPTKPLMDKTQIERIFERPWVDHFWEWPTSSLHPIENFPNCTYGREIAINVGMASLFLACDSAVTGDKTTLLYRFIQVGIDNFALVKAGQRWSSQGGHPIGRKLPILFAGLLLDDQEMLSIGADYPPDSIVFGEDHQIAYVTQEVIDAIQEVEVSGQVLAAGSNTVTLRKIQNPGLPCGISSNNEIIITSGHGTGQRRIFSSFNRETAVGTITENWEVIPTTESQYLVIGYEQKHLGLPEWGSNFRRTGGIQANPSPTASYRAVCSPANVGIALAAQIYGLKEAWNNPAFFDYIDRWVKEVAVQTGESRAYGTGIADMWDTYRANYGVMWEPENGQNGSEHEILDREIIQTTELIVRNNLLKGLNSKVAIKLRIGISGQATIKIYDSKGKEIICLFDGYKDAGEYDLIWTGVDGSGKKVGSGVYMVHMKAGNYRETKKVVIIK